MVEAPADRPSALRRAAAVLSILLVLAVIVVTVVLASQQAARLLAAAALIAVAALAVWYALTRAGRRRFVGVALAVAAVSVLAVAFVAGNPLSVVIRVLLLVLAAGLARYALARDIRTLKATATAGTPVPAARQGVLIMNLKSGGGKAERFGLADECRRRGIEPVVLQPGDDLLVLARDAIDRGADVIGMAGGDGSQALVAGVAAERGIPMVVVPAGTRNHLALDLGIDRNDVVGALDAYGEAVERPMDLGDVNGRVFVNNVSLGLYATIVQSPEYRDAKVNTTLAALPKVLGPGTPPIDLRFDGPDGVHHDGAHMILVSNGPYGTTMSTMGSRARVDAGTLGVIALVIPDDGAATRFLGALATGHPERYGGFQSWSTPSFEVSSGAPIAIGLDGETMELDAPLRFTVRPGVLRVRLAPNAIGYSPTARKLMVRQLLPLLWRTAREKAVGIGT
jgi:diacylglycerol kinase family enzyme